MRMAKARRLNIIDSTRRRRRRSRWRQRPAACIIASPDSTEPWRSIDKWVVTPAQFWKPLGHTLQALRSGRQRTTVQVHTKARNSEVIGAKLDITSKVRPTLVQRFRMRSVPMVDEVRLSTPGRLCMSSWTCWFETRPDPGLIKRFVLAQGAGCQTTRVCARPLGRTLIQVKSNMDVGPAARISHPSPFAKTKLSNEQSPHGSKAGTHLPASSEVEVEKT